MLVLANPRLSNRGIRHRHGRDPNPNATDWESLWGPLGQAKYLKTAVGHRHGCPDPLRIVRLLGAGHMVDL